MKNIPLIISLMIFTGTTTYNMDKQPLSAKKHVLQSKKCLSTITVQICTITQSLPETVRTIKRFALVNKRLQRYYIDPETRKQIVRTIAIHHNMSDLCVAQACGYQKIAERIKTLFAIPSSKNLPFTQEDLKDVWYLNATIAGKKDSYFPQLTLLLNTTAAFDIEKTRALVAANSDCNPGRCHSPLALLAGPDMDFNSLKMLSAKSQKKHFALLELFLKAQVDPDDRCQITSPTNLHRAVNDNDQHYARLLLEHGANPYTLYFDDFYKQYNCYDKYDKSIGKWVKWTHPEFAKFKKTAKQLPINTLYFESDNNAEPWKQNAFHLQRGEPKGWLKTMYDAIQVIKKSPPPAAELIDAVFNNDVILHHITQQICVANNWNIILIKNDIRALTRVNKKLSAYFSQYFTHKMIAKNMIRTLAFNSGNHEQCVAKHFGNRKIMTEIKRLFGIATTEENFTKKDLQDQWYLNATGWCTCEDNRHATLLLASIKTYDARKVKMLLKAKIGLIFRGKSPILFMAHIDYPKLERKEKEGFFAIVRLFIKEGIHPDDRLDVTCHTLLHRAAANNNRHFAYSLLRAGADPYKLLILPPRSPIAQISINEQLMEHTPTDPYRRNAFCIEDEKCTDWLKTMYNEFQPILRPYFAEATKGTRGFGGQAGV